MSENTYLQIVKNELAKRNIAYHDSILGIQFSTGIDSWIVAISDVVNEMAIPVLYHKNLNKNKNALDYHIQMRRPITPWNLVSYTLNHQKKYATKLIS